jgi:hypothetical protein
MDAAVARNPIDAFILAGLKEHGLAPSPEADKRTLIRRVTFDLTGLPPTFQQVEAFVRDDSPDAYEKLVDRLLASPDYGVHWARHWLDVARFGESDGFERDQYRADAWRYRDWVVDAFNSDMPYDRFVRMQIAGDVTEPVSADGIIATGFLVGTARDVVGEAQQSAAMRAVVRQDQLEDFVGTVSQTFLGLTANCARCHNHKFDPISQREYYQLASALAGVKAGERDLPANAAHMAATAYNAVYERRLAQLQSQIASIEKPVREKLIAKHARDAEIVAPKPIAEWRFNEDLRDHVGSMDATLIGDAKLADGALKVGGSGYAVTSPIAVPLTARTLQAWVVLHDLKQGGGGVMSLQTPDGNAFDAIVYAERQPRQWMAGSNNYQRTLSFDGPEEQSTGPLPVQMTIVYQADGTIIGYRNGLPYGRAYKSSGPLKFQSGKAQLLFGLRHLPAGGNKFLTGEIVKARLYDRALSAAEVAASAGVKPGISDAEVIAGLSETERAQRDVCLNEMAVIHRQQVRAASAKTYTCAAAENPGITHLLLRGNPASESDVVSPGGLSAIAGLDADFGLKPDAPDAKRRRKLADWITDARNPLFSRVIVNRLWLYHFGDGIVETPNDFGFNGSRPSNVELLDYLANQMQGGGWSIKKMQRLIVTSAAYRQSSLPRGDGLKADASNRLLWRMSPRRIEAEALRDAILQTAGELNPQRGGPGYEDYYTFTNNTTFYESRDYSGATFNRRSLYRNWIRSGRNPFLDVFDCPDPSTKTPRRALTTTPLQALALMNDSFVFRMSDSVAGAVKRQAGENTARQAEAVYERVLDRKPSAEEAEDAVNFIRKHGLPALCRVMFNCSEFVTVD